MEVFNSPIIGKTQFLSSISPSKPTLLFSNRLRTNPLRTTRGFHPRYISFSASSTKVYNGGQNLQILAQFRQGSKRRNSLRKKINEEQQLQQVLSRNFDSSLDPSSKFQNPIVIIPDDELEQGFDSNLEESNSGGGSDENSIALGDSVLLNKLENWVDQYKAETEFWGIGSGPVFTVFQDIEGNVKRVSVNEDEILQRRGVDAVSYNNNRQGELGEDFVEVNSKISHAKSLAREIETGEYKLSKSSSIAKFVVEREQSRLINGIQSFTLRPDINSKLSRFGFAMLCGLLVLGIMKMIFFGGNNARKLTREEKEMLRRKMKSRTERGMMVRGNVEVIPHVSEPLIGSMERPRLDKEELMNTIVKVKAEADKVQLRESSARFTTKSNDFYDKINEIKEMARRARKIEKQKASFVDEDEEENEEVKLASDSEDIGKNEEVAGLSSLNTFPKEDSKKSMGSDEAKKLPTLNDLLIVTTGLMLDKSAGDATIDTDIRPLIWTPSVVEPENGLNPTKSVSISASYMGVEKEDTESCATPYDKLSASSKSYIENKPSEAQPVKEAREYLSEKHDDKRELRQDHKFRTLIKGSDAPEPPADEKLNGKTNHILYKEPQVFKETSDTNSLESVCEGSILKKAGSDGDFLESIPNKIDNSEDMDKNKVVDDLQDSKTAATTNSLENVCEGYILKKAGSDGDFLESIPNKIDNYEDMDKKKGVNDLQDSKTAANTNALENVCEGSILKKAESDGDFLESIPNKIDNSEDIDKKKGVDDLQDSKTAANHRDGDHNAEDAPIAKETWIEKNIEEFEPIVKKIKVGFKENYKVAKEKVQEELNLNTDVSQLRYDEDEDELEWMKNDGLREIVFQVQENELMGRDPFHMMDAEDKRAFFEGLEKKVEKVNTKLLNLHEWVHSNVENLDYGADGISLYDPLEKIIPRWKGPPVDKDPEFLNNFEEEPKEFSAEGLGTSSAVNEDTKDTLQQSVKSPGRNDTSSAVHNLNTGVSVSPKTVIESSDGSSRAGKKSGKEYWQHTKKWSRGFLDSYNAESDPEVKSVMKDMGKDLDRWITEKEIQETSELMTKIPKKRREHIEKKLGRVKQEVEMFGPQAVVSKYREYAEEKEEDYLWWLDLPYVLCIELYTTEDGAQKVGFYSLEMAVDLELDPKQYHVIAFEDPRDSKHFCHIMQAHMEMLGNGSVFVVARPPKDAFREAKASGFSVTVIRRGALTLNVDQTLEEVEEQITEIGSKMYHDKIMRERSVDIGSLTKGVFGSSKPTTRRRSKGKLKRPTKS